MIGLNLFWIIFMVGEGGEGRGGGWDWLFSEFWSPTIILLGIRPVTSVWCYKIEMSYPVISKYNAEYKLINNWLQLLYLMSFFTENKDFSSWCFWNIWKCFLKWICRPRQISPFDVFWNLVDAGGTWLCYFSPTFSKIWSNLCHMSGNQLLQALKLQISQ